MDKKELKEHIKTLSQLTGPSGYEDEVRDYLREEWAGLVDTFELDGLGSLVAIKYGTGNEPRQRIMLSAHMDEIGLLVTEIKDGYLRLADIWGSDSRLMLAKPVLIHTRTGTLRGVVAAQPPHITRHTGNTKEYPPFAQQWVDLGLPADEVTARVRIGDPVTMDAPVVELMGDQLATKAMDDRASVASVTACLHYLQTRNHNWDVYAVASVQEEVGLKGAATAAYYTRPDLAIAIDVTFAQQPGVNGDQYVKLGSGPTLGIGPNFHDGLVKGLQKAAGDLEMSVTTSPMPRGSGTDAWAIQISREGVPTALLSIPLRSMHAPVETISLKDVERTGRLMAEFIAGLTEDYLETIAWKPDADDDNENGDDAE